MSIRKEKIFRKIKRKTNKTSYLLKKLVAKKASPLIGTSFL